VVHVVGKDILRFHAVFWPAFLMSAGLPLPTQVVSHGFWLKDQRKMSKSVGNVVRPDALVDAFGVDALRWHLISEMSFGQDASFSDEAFLVRYNSDLANGLGNTLSRAVRMASDAFGGKTPSEHCDDNDVKRVAEEAVATWDAAFRGCRLHEAAEAIRTLLGAIDGYITAKEPWKRVKAEGVTPALHRIHYNALEGLRIAAVMLAPIAPGASVEVLRRLGTPKSAEELRPSDLAWGGLPLGAPLAPAAPLFPRADAKAYFGQQAADAKASLAEKAKESPVTEETKPVAEAPAAAALAAPVAPVPAAPGTPSAVAAAPAAPAAEPARITVDDLFKADLRVAEIISAEKVEKSKKLMKMRVRIGEEERTIVAGIATAYTGEQLVGRKVVVVANLLPAKLMGIESNGMVLAASLPGTGEPSLLAVDPSVPSGTKVK
jgi:methionyl-tRNA synthetase